MPDYIREETECQMEAFETMLEQSVPSTPTWASQKKSQSQGTLLH